MYFFVRWRDKDFLNGGKKRSWNALPVMNYQRRATFFSFYSRYRGEFLDVISSSIEINLITPIQYLSLYSEWIIATSGTLLFDISPLDHHEDVLTKRSPPESNMKVARFSQIGILIPSNDFNASELSVAIYIETSKLPYPSRVMFKNY